MGSRGKGSAGINSGPPLTTQHNAPPLLVNNRKWWLTVPENPGEHLNEMTRAWTAATRTRPADLVVLSSAPTTRQEQVLTVSAFSVLCSGSTRGSKTRREALVPPTANAALLLGGKASCAASLG